jgi:hypothetical protein
MRNHLVWRNPLSLFLVNERWMSECLFYINRFAYDIIICASLAVIVKEELVDSN